MSEEKADTTPIGPERLDLRSHDIADERRQELLRLFPEVRTDGGKVDFDRLKLSLGESIDVGRERYGLTWPGKADCFKAIQTPSMGTLRPCPEESVNFDTTENLIIEGDNLEVLKLLQKSYLGKVKMIYIDPPYNTGNDFIYPDNYTESLQTYLEYTGQVDSQGKKFSTNTEADGRFHSKWLNMMYPRLYLARNLLRDDGVIFISIDDNELDSLKRICNEVFGDENFIATIIWQKYFSPKSTARHLSTDHDYILLYGRNAASWDGALLPRTDDADARYTNPDADPRGDWTSAPLQARNYYSRGTYEVVSPSGRKHWPPKGTYWRISEDKFQQFDADNRIWWGADGDNVPRIKRFLTDVRQGIVPRTLWLHEEVGHTQEAKKELLDNVRFQHTENVLDSVKPTRLIRRMLQLSTKVNDRDTVLDFFGGSGTTAHATTDQNQADGGDRRFIIVQLPEPLPKPEGKLRTLIDIALERQRAVTQRPGRDEQMPLNKATDDRGFRFFKLAESNLRPWSAEVAPDAGALEKQLDLHVDHIHTNRTSQDILYEILLKDGFPLTTTVEPITLEGKTVFSVARGALLVCLEPELTIELVRALADRKPERVVCLDAGFAGRDELKANAVQIFRSKDVKNFKTV